MKSFNKNMDNFHLFLNTHLNKPYSPTANTIPKDYVVVRGTTALMERFEENVKIKLSEGYVPCGGATAARSFIYQPMCLYAREDETE